MEKESDPSLNQIKSKRIPKRKTYPLEEGYEKKAKTGKEPKSIIKSEKSINEESIFESIEKMANEGFGGMKREPVSKEIKCVKVEQPTSKEKKSENSEKFVNKKTKVDKGLKISNKETKKEKTNKAQVLKPNNNSNKKVDAHTVCQKPSCPCTKMICFANASKTCSGYGQSARWYHMSDKEHFCNNCFDYFYRTHKDGYKLYDPWKLRWNTNCRKEATLKIFMGEEILPFWAECTKCDRWRQLNEKIVLTREMAKNFKCSDVEGGSCKIEEDRAVKDARDFKWVSSVVSLPYLKDSPAAPFLRDFYYDGIGLSPPLKIPEEPVAKFAENIVPFYSAEDSERARCICADVMTEEERQKFPHCFKYASVYLSLRNLALAMWNLNPYEHLTYKTSVKALLTRGLSRVTLAEELKHVLDFLTLSGYINFGILPPPSKIFNFGYWKGSVIVIGGGIAGIAAAQRLKSAGCQVRVLESSDRCGGRIKDDNSLGNSVGLGAQIITGCINNPLYIMCNQMDISLRYLGNECDLINDAGVTPERPIDREVEFRFNLMLDSLEEWKQSINKDDHEDFSLSEALLEQLNELQKTLCKNMSQIEKDLLQFHLGNLEYGCGSSLKNVSAVNWNQNEEFPQYSGHHAWAIDGFESIVHKLAKDLNIVYNSSVASVDSSGTKIKVKTKDGAVYSADKVVCAVPLTVYQSRLVTFKPALPKEKQAAIDRLGAGLIEKVALKFSKPFWRKRIGKADIFGHIPGCVEDRGLFSVFYDVSKGDNHILMTVIAGEALKLKAELSDKDLVKRCMTTLRNIFKNEKIPEPTSYVISNWAKDPSIKMSYSFVKVGSSGKDLDIISRSYDDKLYFAGEHTNRQFPQTATGAFLSGLREAKKILETST